MAGVLVIKFNGEPSVEVNFDSLEGVDVQGNVATHYRAPDPENDTSYINILGEGLVANSVTPKE